MNEITLPVDYRNLQKLDPDDGDYGKYSNWDLNAKLLDSYSNPYKNEAYANMYGYGSAGTATAWASLSTTFKAVDEGQSSQAVSINGWGSVNGVVQAVGGSTAKMAMKMSLYDHYLNQWYDQQIMETHGSYGFLDIIDSVDYFHDLAYELQAGRKYTIAITLDASGSFVPPAGEVSSDFGPYDGDPGRFTVESFSVTPY